MPRLAPAWPFAVVLAGCEPSTPPPQAGAAPATATSATQPIVSSSDVTMRYACDAGHRVDIVRDIARITLSDGRVVKIARVPNSAPPRYSGEALSFEIGSNGATLGQDEAGGFACREAD